MILKKLLLFLLLFGSIEGSVNVAGSDLEKEQCRQVINQAFKEGQTVSRKDKETVSVGEFGLLSGPNKSLLMIKEGSEVAGTALVTFHNERELGFAAYIQYLSVLPKSWNKGYGKKLVEEAESLARKQGCDFVYLCISYHPEVPQEKLQRFYQKLGYQVFRSKNLTLSDKKQFYSRKYWPAVSLYYYAKRL